MTYARINRVPIKPKDSNDQGAKSQSMSNDQAPMTKERPERLSFWSLHLGTWGLIGIWLLGHWDVHPRHLFRAYAWQGHQQEKDYRMPILQPGTAAPDFTLSS